MVSDLLLRKARFVTLGADGAGVDLLHGPSMELPSDICQAIPNDKRSSVPLHFAPQGARREKVQTFGQRVRAARDAMGLTQEQLGFAVGVSKASISAWENDRERPGFDNLPKLRAALQESLDDLILGFKEAALTARAAMNLMEGKPPDYLRNEDSRCARDEKEYSALRRFRALTGKKKESWLELLKPER
jgi:transcriptional regulator with XRE-family HTH domain